MAITNPQHQQFIEKCVEYQRDHIRAAMEVYGCITRKHAATQGGKLLKNGEIKGEIDRRLKEITDIGTKAAAKEVKKRITKRVLTLMDKRQILASIAMGTYKVKIPYIDSKGKVRYMTRTPLPNEARLAMDLDAQLMGEKSNDKADPGKLPSDTPGETVINKLASADLASLINLMNASPLPNTSR